MATPSTERVAARRDAVGWAGAAALAVVLTAIGWVRHRNGWSGGLDLGIFDQGVWLLSEGHWPDVTQNAHNLFADHFSPVLLLFVPLYVAAPTPVWLLLAQSASIGAVLPALRRFAADRGVATGPVTVAAALSAPMLAAAVFDAHPLTMAVGPLAWLLVALERGSTRRVVVLALAVVACRGELGWVVASLAIVAPPARRRLLVGVGLGGSVLGALVPPLFGQSTFPVFYGHLGESATDAALHPWRLLTAFTAADLRTVFLWLLAGGFVCVRKPRWAVTVVVAGLPLLASQWPGTEQPYFHHGAPYAVIVLAGAVVALADERSGASPRHLVAGALVASLLMGPFSPKATEANSFAHVFSANFDGQLAEALAAVGPDEPVAAVNRVLPHLSQREEVYGFPLPFVDTALSDHYGGADPEAASRIAVVIVDEAHREQAEALGFELEDLGELLVGRRQVAAR